MAKWMLIFEFISSIDVNKDAISLETSASSVPPARGCTVLGCIIFGKWLFVFQELFGSTTHCRNNRPCWTWIIFQENLLNFEMEILLEKCICRKRVIAAFTQLTNACVGQRGRTSDLILAWTVLVVNHHHMDLWCTVLSVKLQSHDSLCYCSLHHSLPDFYPLSLCTLLLPAGHFIILDLCMAGDEAWTHCKGLYRGPCLFFNILLNTVEEQQGIVKSLMPNVLKQPSARLAVALLSSFHVSFNFSFTLSGEKVSWWAFS